MTNIKNTMSDRASTETKFNHLSREEILPQVFTNYETMNFELQQALNRMNNFFCGLHTLVHMADVSQKAIDDVQVPGFLAWFNVVYDDDQSVYTSKLDEEYKEEDVIVKA